MANCLSIKQNKTENSLIKYWNGIKKVNANVNSLLKHLNNCSRGSVIVLIKNKTCTFKRNFRKYRKAN